MEYRCYYPNQARKRLRKFCKPLNKYALNTTFQYYKGIIQGDSFILATVFESTIFATW